LAETSAKTKATITDKTQNWSFSETGSGLIPTLAQFGDEDIGRSQWGVCDYGEISYSTATLNGKALGSLGPQKVERVDASGNVEETPSAINDHKDFSITWVSST
jgi:hypothetical protein